MDSTSRKTGELDLTAIIGWGVIAVVLFFVLVTAIQAFFYRYERAYLAERVYAEAPVEPRRIRDEQLERISGYRWVDRENGVVAIPIDRAMELVVEEYGVSAE